MKKTTKLLTLSVIIISLQLHSFSYSPNSGNYFSIGIGYLLEKSNPLLEENIVIIQVSDSIKFSEKVSGIINFTVSFPDERMTFVRLRTFGNFLLHNIDWIINFSVCLNSGFENISYFVNKSISSEISFKYYSIFTPYISTTITLSTKLLVEIFGSIGIVGGIPFLFLPNTQPFTSSFTYFQIYQVGIKNIILDEISLHYDYLTLSVFLTKRF